MKLSTQEKIRLTELLAGIGVAMVYQYTQLGNLHENFADIQVVSGLALTPYILNAYTSLRQEMHSEEYKEIKRLYDDVVNSTILLMDEMHVEDPVAIFATYMYMYRHGYLSLNHDFVYKNDMKDFAKLGGVDVIRGKGVCRSVASMLTDIYNSKGLTATNLTVKANNVIPKIETLCDKGKPQVDEQTKKFVKYVVAITKHMPLANHLITSVEKDGKNYILDPMNDGFLQKGKGAKLLLANDPSVHMTLFYGQQMFSGLLGNTYTLGTLKTQNQLAMPTIDYKEYKDIYLETLHFCQDHKFLFEDFYHANQENYEMIHDLSNQQANNLIRMFGFGPIQKTLKRNIQK